MADSALRNEFIEALNRSNAIPPVVQGDTRSVVLLKNDWEGRIALVLAKDGQRLAFRYPQGGWRTVGGSELFTNLVAVLAKVDEFIAEDAKLVDPATVKLLGKLPTVTDTPGGKVYSVVLQSGRYGVAISETSNALVTYWRVDIAIGGKAHDNKAFARSDYLDAVEWVRSVIKETFQEDTNAIAWSIEKGE